MRTHATIRGLLAGALVGILAGAILISPVGAHITKPGHTWKKHFLRLAQKKFYTKAQANSMFASFEHTIIVSPAGTPTGSGDALRQAVNEISGATATSPVLVSVEPGTYDLGTTPLTLPDHVGLLGSGRDLTRLTCACGTASNTSPSNGATLVTGLDAEVRSLSVMNSDDASVVHGINLGGDGDTLVRLSDISVSATGSSSTALLVGIWNMTKDVELRDVEVIATGQGAESVVAIQMGSIAAPSSPIEVSLQDVNASALASAPGDGTAETFALALGGADTTIQGGIFETENAPDNRSIYANQGSINATGFRALSVGGGDLYQGVRLMDASGYLQDAQIKAEGIEAGGLHVELTGASDGLTQRIEVHASTIEADGSIVERGVNASNASTTGSGEIWIQGSLIRGSTTVSASSVYTVHMRATGLEGGGPSGAATFTCVATWAGTSFQTNFCPS